MGASITILGINEEVHKVINLEELVDAYYQSFNDDTKPIIGMDVVFELGIEKHCFEICEMLEYYRLGFKWIGNNEIERHENSFIVSKKLLLDLIDWFIALCYVFNNSEEVVSKPITYVDKALEIKHNYNCEYEFFTFSYFTFIDLKTKIESGIYQNYLWTYSV